MTKHKTLIILLASILACLTACRPSEHTPEGSIDSLPPIYPDYTGVTLPPNMVPPRFWVPDSCGYDAVQAVFRAGDASLVVDGEGRRISMLRRDWEGLIEQADSVEVTLLAKKDGRWLSYRPFVIHIAPEPIDAFIAYRLIEPGYESWNQMGIYQRCLESYRADPIITNRETDYGCMNCHSFCQQNPDHMLLHLRKELPGTYIIEDGKVEKLNTATDQTISPLVYPYWHPSGRYVAFSVNDTKQMFHTTDRNRIEVYDNASDVVVYDTESHEILSSPRLMSAESFETFPSFSPDGRTLYFCTADSVSMPDRYNALKYNICAISFDPDTRAFGAEVDTVYNAVADDHSASFPRVSPDGRFLMFTRADYGTFSIWHRDADLWMIDLVDGRTWPLDALNSDETESYHSWSHDGRWVVFSSRREDGLYTRPYFAYIDADGNPRKPIMLPPQSEDYYERMLKSYNVPEFITSHVTVSSKDITSAGRTAGTNVTFAGCPADR